MRIGVLVLAAGRQAGGPETYEVQLLRALAALDSVNEYTIYCPDARASEAIDINQPNVKYRVLKPFFRVASLSLSLPYLLRADLIDVFHATYAPPPIPPARMVFTCHGLSNFLYRDCFPTATRWRLNWLQRLAIQHALRIICVSEHTALQLKEKMHVSADRLSLVLHGVSTDFFTAPRQGARESVMRKFNLRQSFVLHVGKVQKIKNIARLVEAFQEFRSRCCPNVQLVLAGKILDEPSVLRHSKPEDGIVKLGHVATADLPDLYRAAEMLVFPSLFESFGLPVIEAMCCGTPVVSSTAGALPEVCGNAALLVNPYSTGDIAQAMATVLCNRELREELIALGIERSKRYSWERTAKSTLDVYNDVHQRVPRERAT
jgi:glycosyltransferase involved in cell wall biosynthesis